MVTRWRRWRRRHERRSPGRGPGELPGCGHRGVAASEGRAAGPVGYRTLPPGGQGGASAGGGKGPPGRSGGGGGGDEHGGGCPRRSTVQLGACLGEAVTAGAGRVDERRGP